MKYIILLVTICIIIIFKNLVNILKYLRLYIYAKKQVLKLYKKSFFSFCTLFAVQEG